MAFKRVLKQNLINKLNELHDDENSWWHKMVEDDSVFILIRNNRLHVLANGGLLLQVSMDYNNKLINAKRALKRFIDQIDLNCNNVVIVSFGEEINCSRLSNNYEYLAKQINNIDAGGCTPMLEAIKKVKGIVHSKQKAVLIIATDGEPSTIYNGFIDFNHAKKEILDYIMPLKNKGIRFITIGIGNDIDEGFLIKVATSKNDYYHSEDSIHLNHIYQKIVGGLRLIE